MTPYDPNQPQFVPQPQIVPGQPQFVAGQPQFVEHQVQRTVQVPVEHIVHQQVNPVVAQAVEPVAEHWSKWWWLPLLLLGLLGTIFWHGCRTTTPVAPIAPITQTVHNTITETHTAQAVTETVHEDVTETIHIQGELTEAQAREIAVAHVGDGTATSAEHSTDHGAMWVVLVTHGGAQTDVYVNSQGQVVHSQNR